jgi:flagella basal body P-ring formation protein FlgA
MFRFLPLFLVLTALPSTAASLEAQTEAAARSNLQTLAQQNHIADADIRVSAQTLRGTTVPDCAQPYAITAVETRYPARMRFQALCPGSSTPINLLVHADISATVLVAARNISAGEPLTADDLREDTRDILSLADAVGDAADVIGQASRRPLRSGQLILRRQIEAALQVHRGQSVSIVATGQAIQVTAPAEALENGKPGDIIRVRNAASGKTIAARVSGPGQVEPVH